MPGLQVDGNVVAAVYSAVADAARRARDGGGPTLIEAMTYRQVGHSRSDPATYRPPGELDAWLERDPIELLEAALRDAGVDAEQLAQVRQHAHDAVAGALDRAAGWADPAPESRLADVWV